MLWASRGAYCVRRVGGLEAFKGGRRVVEAVTLLAAATEDARTWLGGVWVRVGRERSAMHGSWAQCTQQGRYRRLHGVGLAVQRGLRTRCHGSSWQHRVYAACERIR